MKEDQKKLQKKPLVLDEEELKLKSDAWDIFYGRGPTRVQAPVHDINIPDISLPPASVPKSKEGTIAESATVEINSTVADSAETQAKYSTVAEFATVTVANNSTVAENATVAYSSTVALAATVPFYTYWFRYTLIGHWVDDHLGPILLPTTSVVYKRLFRLAYGFRENQGYCDVGLTTLAKSCNISKRKAQDIIYELERFHSIKRIQTFNEGPEGKRGTRYQVLIPSAALKALEEVEGSFGKRKTVAKNSTVENSATVAKNSTVENSATVENPATNIKDDEDDTIENNLHHRELVKKIYTENTGNRWTTDDDESYAKICQVRTEIAEQGIKLVVKRSKGHPNSLGYFVKEILRLANPSPESRAQTKKALARVIENVRSLHLGETHYTFSDFVEDVKCACARDDIPFDNDLFNELIG